MRSNLDECDDWYNQTEIDKMNRDYFARPIQGSRSSYDYGRSGPIEPLATEGHSAAAYWLSGLFVGLIVGIPLLIALGW